MPSFRLVAFLVLVASPGAASGQTWLDEGLTALRDGEVSIAAERFAEAVEVDPDDARASALLALAEAEDPGDERRALDRALRLVPNRPELHQMRLARLRQDVGEARVLSVADSRRITAARRLVALDAGSALGHEELALYAFLDYQWRRRNAERRGIWNPVETNYATRAALRARDEAAMHLDAATETDPAWAGAHRLRMRIAAFDADPQALVAAAQTSRRDRPSDPWSHLYVGLAYARLGHDAEAEAACRLGVDGLAPMERDVFLSPSRFVRLSDRDSFAADSAAWSMRFWRTSGDRLLTDANERWVEHCARLVEADLLYEFDEVRGWDTARGDTHVRYGAPVRDMWWLVQGDGSYHQWEYEDFVVTFHDWVSSGHYEPASSFEGEDDATRLRSRNNTVAETGRGDRVLPIPVVATAFRGPGGRTEWVVAYRAEAGGPRAGLRSGVFVMDEQGDVLTAQRQDGADFAAHRGGWTGTSTVLDPGATLVVEADRNGSRSYGRAEVALPERSFSGAGLQVSDLLLAYRVDLVEDTGAPPGHVRRGDYVLHPAPDSTFVTGDPLVVYAEAYGLRLDAGSTRFDVEAVLEPIDDAGRIRRLGRRLLGRRPPASVAVTSEQEGSSVDDTIAFTLDLQNQPPGPYRLTLSVHDLVADATVSASRLVRLDSP